MAQQTTLHIGTYASAGGEGLVPLTLAADGALAAGEPYPAAANASFAVVSRRGLAFFADEAAGMVGVHRREGAGWRELARVPTGGAAPCYLALDHSERRLAVANYESGHVALFALDGEGLPQAPAAVFRQPGSGPDEERQEGPHAHCVRFSRGGEALYWVDLGADRVECLTLGKGAVFLETHQAWRAPPGSGPRHLLFHPGGPLAVVLSELASTLTVLQLRDGRLYPLQTVSTLPAGWKGESLGGHLALNAAGTRVYASNRGHDSIAVFALEGGRLHLLQHLASGGAHPRHFALLEEQGLLVAAHEKDGRITAFALGKDGTLEPRGEGTTVPGACFVLG